MKKLICSVMSIITAFSLCIPAVAADETTAYSQTEISAMTVSEFSEICEEATNLTPQLEQVMANVEFLQARITDETVVESLSVNDLDTLVSIVKSNSLDTNEADNLLNTWQACEWVTGNTDVDYEYAEMLRARDEVWKQEESITPYSYNGNVTTDPNSADCTGVHYMVRSSLGFERASGTFTLPSLSMKSSTADPDVPYGFFGIYTSKNELGFDLGTGYKQADDQWFFVISGYAKNSSGKYAKYWVESDKKFAPGTISKVNFVASITKGNTYDTLNLAIVNASNWTTIGKITLNTCDTGYNGERGASQSYVSTNFSNVFMNREVTLAHDYQSNRPLTGTSIVGAKWSDVYLYNTGTKITTKWVPSYTQFAKKIGQTTAYANKVQVSVTTKWSADTTSIYYR